MYPNNSGDASMAVVSSYFFIYVNDLHGFYYI